jgi:hypothetical protein
VVENLKRGNLHLSLLDTVLYVMKTTFNSLRGAITVNAILIAARAAACVCAHLIDHELDRYKKIKTTM